MKFLIPLFVIVMMFEACNSSKINYPETKKENVVDSYFGEQVSEPYRWLENDTSAATAEWVKAQNKVTADYLSKIPFRDQLKKRLTELTNYPRYGSPFKKNGKYYFYKNNGLQNQSVLYCEQSLNAEPEILLDPNTFSQDGTVALSDVAFSQDGKYMSYSIARSGSDWNEIFVMDLKTKTVLKDHIQWSKSSEIAWYGNGFYYSAFDAPEAGKEYSSKNEYEKVYYHTVGQNQSEDKIVYEDKEHALRECYSEVTDDENYLFISITETTTGNGLLMKDLTKPSAQFVEVAPGFDNDHVVIDDVNGKIYILTNWKAPKQRLMSVDPKAPSRENWKEVIAESDNVLESVSVVGGKIIALYMKDACHHAFAYNMDGKQLYEIQLPGLGSITEISGSKDDTEAFYTFTSYTYPLTVYHFDVEKNLSEALHKPELSFNVADYTSEQVFYESKDGTKVPMRNNFV